MFILKATLASPLLFNEQPGTSPVHLIFESSVAM